MTADEPSPPARDEQQQPPRIWRRWLVRGLVAVLIGLALGAVGGLLIVNTLEPGNPDQADSLQLLLDSVARSNSEPEPTRRDTVTPPPPPPDPDTMATVVAVPDLANLDEGSARAVLIDLGFEVGTILFRSSPRPAGTVLSTFPVAGERVPLPATVNLILSDGRGSDSTPPPDSLSTFSLRP